MSGGHFEHLDEEERALHDSWENVTRVMLVVALLSVVVWTICAALHHAVHFVEEHLLDMVDGHHDTFDEAALFAALLVGGLVRGWLSTMAGVVANE